MLLSYTLRNMVARPTVILPALFAVALTVATTTILLASLTSLLTTVFSSADPDNVIVLAGHIDPEEGGSHFAIGDLPLIRSAPGVAREGTEELVSGEIMTVRDMLRTNGTQRLVTVRGVDPIAFRVHRGVRLEAGTWPTRSTKGVVIGAQQVGRYRGFTLGGVVRIGHEKWPVLGIFSAPGTKFESEVWCDREALAATMRHPTLTSAAVRLTSPDLLDRFLQPLARLPEPLQVVSERSFEQNLSKRLDIYVRAVKAVVVLLLFASIFACSNAMYSVILERLRELAMLLAIGYTRRQVAVLLLQESMLIAFVGALLGFGASLLVHGRQLSIDLQDSTADSINLICHIRLTPLAVQVGLFAALMVGVVGGVVSLVQSRRIPILESLRGG